MTRQLSKEAAAAVLPCPICLEAPSAPMTTPCGHTFCRACIMTTLRCSRRECPTCRAPLPSHRVLDECDETDFASHGDSWTCAGCTMANPSSTLRCKACSSRRPSTHRWIAPAEPPQYQLVSATIPKKRRPKAHKFAKKAIRKQTKRAETKKLEKWTLLSNTSHVLSVGERVQGKYQGIDGGVNWFGGAVRAVNEDGTCDISYEDGDEESEVQRRYVKVCMSKEAAEEEAEEAEAEAMSEAEDNEGDGDGHEVRRPL